MIAVTIFADQIQYPLARRFRNDLSIRGVPVRVEGTESGALDYGPASANIVAVVIFPPQGYAREQAVTKLDTLASLGYRCIAMDLSDETLSISRSGVGPSSVLNCATDDYDNSFEDLFRALLIPAWFPFDVRVRPSVMNEPTGVAWWRDDIYFLDERFEHVGRVGIGASAVVLPGLYEPKHVSLDRRKIYIANKAANEIIYADIVDGYVDNVRVLAEALGRPFSGPHAMHGGNYVLAIADTDNHRVLIAENTIDPGTAEWVEAKPLKPLRGPCGVFVDHDSVWIADTFSHRIVRVDHKGGELSVIGTAGYGSGQSLELNYPVAVARHREHLIVVDGGNRRLCIVELSKDDAVSRIGYFSNPIVGGNAFSLSVNSDDRIAISDEGLRCVWTGPVSALVRMAGLT